MKYIIIAGIVLVQIVASYFLQKSLFFGDVAEAGSADPEAVSTQNGESDVDSSDFQEAIIIMLDEIIVNPAGTEGRRYLATRVGLQTKSETAEEEILTRSMLIRDVVNALLSSKSINQLSNLAYRDSLRVEIRDVINKQLTETVIDNVVFADYVLN